MIFVFLLFVWRRWTMQCRAYTWPHSAAELTIIIHDGITSTHTLAKGYTQFFCRDTGVIESGMHCWRSAYVTGGLANTLDTPEYRSYCLRPGKGTSQKGATSDDFVETAPTGSAKGHFDQSFLVPKGRTHTAVHIYIASHLHQRDACMVTFKDDLFGNRTVRQIASYAHIAISKSKYLDSTVYSILLAHLHVYIASEPLQSRPCLIRAIGWTDQSRRCAKD